MLEDEWIKTRWGRERQKDVVGYMLQGAWQRPYMTPDWTRFSFCGDDHFFILEEFGESFAPVLGTPKGKNELFGTYSLIVN